MHFTFSYEPGILVVILGGIYIMAYVRPNYKTKKDFIAAVKAGKQHTTYDPSGRYPVTQNGTDVVEGPHYPQPHRWYAQVVVKDGIVISAK